MTQSYYDPYIQQLILQELERQRQEQEQNKSSLSDKYNKLRGYADKAQKAGTDLSDFGDYLSGKDSQAAQNIGSFINKAGTAASNAAGSVSDVLNTPQNYFKGFADRTLGNSMQNLGQSLTGEQGAMRAIGNSLTNSSLLNADTQAAEQSLAGAIASEAPSALTTLGTEAAGTLGTQAAGTSALGASGGPLAALGSMALQGTNRKRAEHSGEQLMKAAKQASQQGNLQQQNNLQQIMQNTQQLGNQQYGLNSSIGNYGLNNVSDSSNTYNGITGGAAPLSSNVQGIVDNLLTKFRNGRTRRQNNAAANTEVLNNTAADTVLSSDNNSIIGDYQNYLRNSGYSDNVVNGVLQGLNSGNKEIADRITQYNQGAGKDNPINIPQTGEEIALARAGKFNTEPLTGGVIDTKAANDTEKQALINRLLSKFASGITDFSRGYNENRNNGFSPSNLTNDKFTETTKTKGGEEETTTKTYDKSKMGRLGEAVGTMGRLVQNPTFQALAAGSISTALTGNPLYGAGMAYKFGNNRAMSDIYQQALAENGIETNPGIWGNLTSNDMNTLMTPVYKKQENDLKLAQQDYTQAWKNLDAYLRQQQLEEAIKHNRATEANQAKETNIRAQQAAIDKDYKTKKLAIDEKKSNNQGKTKNKTQNSDINKDPDFISDYNNLIKLKQMADDPKSNVSEETCNKVLQDMITEYAPKYGLTTVKKILNGK